ncbi:UNVERIFIED_CONTAM: Pentatricopeptide repeat-containing protein [Sesamum calycinum]|uniref:Pentatricopeptide repeat-containing protein n=1 Tax=Sesamum calycinum TaxID=2727403 RepID=A0AAW2IUB1_9LAMI
MKLFLVKSEDDVVAVQFLIVTVYGVCGVWQIRVVLIVVVLYKLQVGFRGKQLHAQVITWGLQKNHALVPKLVSLYAAFGLLGDAHHVVTGSHILHPLPWNILISSYVNKGHFEEAIFAYGQMCLRRIRPDDFTYPSVLKACAEQSNLDLGKEVHRSINASSVKWNLFVQNALVSMGKWEEAFELFERMQAAGLELNIITWNTVAGGCLRTGNFKGALQLICQMRMSGHHLDPVAVIIGLGNVSVARRLFDSLDRRDAVTYTSMIAGYGMHGDGLVAQGQLLFERMQAFMG